MFQKKLISIDIGSQNIKIVIGRCNKNKVYIDKLIMTETPTNCIEDGKIIDANRLVSDIKDVLDMNAIKEKDIIFTTNSTDIINREIIVPEAEGEELDTIVQFEIHQYLPIIMEDYIVQFNVLEQVKEEVSSEGIGNKLKMLVVTYPKRMAEAYVKLTEDLKLKPVALDVNFNSVSKLFKDNFYINGRSFIKEQTVVLIDMGAEKIGVNIVHDGKMVFSRIISSGGISIDRKIGRKFAINLDEAEKRKKEFCDLLDNESIEKMEELNLVIKEIVDGWMDEIRKIIQFYRNKNIGNKVDKVFIYGGTSRLKGLTDYMEKQLNIQVSDINSMSNIELSKDVIKEDMNYFINGIGALIRL